MTKSSTQFVCFFFASVFSSTFSKAQPPMGTSSFETDATVVILNNNVCTSNRFADYAGFRFGMRSADRCGLNNATGTGSDGHINFFGTGNVSSTWEEGRISSDDGNEFKLVNFNFSTLTPALVGKTMTVTGYRDGSPVPGASTVSPVIAASGITNIYEVDVNSMTEFQNIDEIRMTLSGTPATGTIALHSITLAPAIASVPVTFESLHASASERGIEVEFFTSEESNVKNYEVQVSDNGRDFSSRATIPAKNTSSNRYAATIPPTSGKVYIRIQSNDLDGSFKHSEIILAGSTVQANFRIYPNPAKDVLFVAGGSNLPFVLSDGQGRNIKTGKISNGKVDIRELNPGIYILKIEGKSYKVVKE